MDCRLEKEEFDFEFIEVVFEKEGYEKSQLAL